MILFSGEVFQARKFKKQKNQAELDCCGKLRTFY